MTTEMQNKWPTATAARTSGSHPRDEEDVCCHTVLVSCGCSQQLAGLVAVVLCLFITSTVPDACFVVT